MNEEEYKNRINKINARLSTDRCSDDEIANLNIQRIYLKDKYIDYVEKELKDKDEKINKIKTAMTWYYENSRLWDCEMTYLNGVHNGMYSTYEEIDEILKNKK